MSMPEPEPMPFARDDEARIQIRTTIEAKERLTIAARRRGGPRMGVSTYLVEIGLEQAANLEREALDVAQQYGLTSLEPSFHGSEILEQMVKCALDSDATEIYVTPNGHGATITHLRNGKVFPARSFTPFEEIRIGTIYDIKDARSLALFLVDPLRSSSNASQLLDHFQKGAWDVITAAILHIAYHPTYPDRTAHGVQTFLNSSQTDCLQEMLKTEHDPQSRYGWTNTKNQTVRSHPAVTTIAQSIEKLPPIERDSIFASAIQYISTNISKINTPTNLLTHNSYAWLTHDCLKRALKHLPNGTSDGLRDIAGIMVNYNMFPTTSGHMINFQLSYRRETVIINPEILAHRNTIFAPGGLFLVASLTGGSKTTTSESLLGFLPNQFRNKCAVEDIPEINFQAIPGCSEMTSVTASPGESIDHALRFIARRFPDFLFVSEIRTSETAHICYDIAATGGVVLTTLHATNARHAIERYERLLEMTPAPSINGCLWVGLIPKLCPNCRMNDTSFASENTRWISTGCTDCHQTGYAGSVQIWELLLKEQHIPMKFSVMQLLADGMISIQDAERVLSDHPEQK